MKGKSACNLEKRTVLLGEKKKKRESHEIFSERVKGGELKTLKIRLKIAREAASLWEGEGPSSNEKSLCGLLKNFSLLLRDEGRARESALSASRSSTEYSRGPDDFEMEGPKRKEAGERKEKKR